ncbi:hypothetical protein V6N11_039544 [Hibiscus sabdariffa]|uniref:Uncharacterized protein n=1 Tax=Hibiscus sabdariffa TaxID=183260 RepID=A0ABR2SN87_9ROSI
MARRRANYISSLKLDGSTWCDDQLFLRQAALVFFQGLFSSSETDGYGYGVRGQFLRQEDFGLDLNMHLLPFPVLLRIVDVKEPDSLFSEDTIRWGLTSNHNFTVKSAYELQFGSLSGDSDRV